jgi:hypothetical protein
MAVGGIVNAIVGVIVALLIVTTIILLVSTYTPPQPPVITSTNTVNGTVGTSMSFQITASNNPTSFTVSNLPPGLNVNPSTGIISGTPTTAGSFNSSVSATNAAGTSPVVPLVFNVVAAAPPPTPAPGPSAFLRNVVGNNRYGMQGNLFESF